jgi:hypothetical protein
MVCCDVTPFFIEAQMVWSPRSPWLRTCPGENHWSRATSFPEKQIVSWMELSADNSALEPRQVSVVPAILNFRSAWDASGTASFRHYTPTQLRSLHSTRRTPDPQPSPLVNSILFVSLVSSRVW